jgi:hypothetical protein
MSDLGQLAIDTIRTLSIDTVHHFRASRDPDGAGSVGLRNG